jgi:hypothetical protein
MPRKSMRSKSRRGGDWLSPSTWSISNPFAAKKDDATITPNNYPPASNGMGYGGRKGKRRRSMRGGDYSANTPTTGMAATAASVSDVKTASAPLVGGRTRRRRHRHRHSKSCKHRKH